MNIRIEVEMKCVKSNFMHFQLSARPNSIEDSDFIMIGVGGFIHLLNHQKQTDDKLHLVFTCAKTKPTCTIYVTS